MTKDELIKKLLICRMGKCSICEYSAKDKRCTDTLIDDVYDYLSGIPYTDNIIKCPYCGKSHYYEQRSTATALYCPTEYVDGQLQHCSDSNYYTTQCLCAECNRLFSYTLHDGKITINT